MNKYSLAVAAALVIVVLPVAALADGDKLAAVLDAQPDDLGQGSQRHPPILRQGADDLVVELIQSCIIRHF